MTAIRAQRSRAMESHGDVGSLAVELTVLMPALFLLAIILLVFGRVANARQQTVEAARAGAEVAAVQPSGSSAQSAATQLAMSDLVDESRACSGGSVSTDITHYTQGGWVTVAVTCSVSLSDLSVPGLPKSTTLAGSSVAPIDPYRSIQ